MMTLTFYVVLCFGVGPTKAESDAAEAAATSAADAAKVAAKAAAESADAAANDEEAAISEEKVSEEAELTAVAAEEKAKAAAEVLTAARLEAEKTQEEQAKSPGGSGNYEEQRLSPLLSPSLSRECHWCGLRSRKGEAADVRRN